MPINLRPPQHASRRISCLLKKPVALAAASSLVFALLTPTAHASDTRNIQPLEEYPDEVTATVEKALSEPLEDSEADFLVEEYPDLASVIPDLRPNESEQTTYQLPTTRQAAGNGCSTAAHNHHETTLLGNTFYNMNTTVDFCWSGNYVNSVSNMNTTFSNIDNFANIVGEFQRIESPGYPGHAKHTYQVENRALGVSISTKYPYNEFFLDAGGSFRASSGNQ